jgi:hypothetical protein
VVWSLIDLDGLNALVYNNSLLTALLIIEELKVKLDA